MSALWMVLEIWLPSLVICYEEGKTISSFVFACFSLGYAVFSSQVMQQVPVKRAGGNTIRENLSTPFTKIHKNQNTFKSIHWHFVAK